MSYLLVKSEEAFFARPFYFLNPGVQPKPAIVGVRLQFLLKRFKASYLQSETHLPFSHFFQAEMNIKDRDTAKLALQILFGQFLLPTPSHAFIIFDTYTPFLVKQMLRHVAIALTRYQYPQTMLLPNSIHHMLPAIDQIQLAKLLHVFQHSAIKSPEIDQFLLDLFVAYQIPQPVIDYEVSLFRSFMNEIFYNLNKRDVILRSIGEWQTYDCNQKVLFLQEFMEWHSSAFGISAPRVMIREYDAQDCEQSPKDYTIFVTSLDIESKHIVELILHCLHQNMLNYQMHLFRDFNLDSRQDPLFTTDFYNKLSALKEVRDYVKVLYSSVLNDHGDDGLYHYYLQPSRFHAFTHEFFFATLFLEDFREVDLSLTLFLYQKIGSLLNQKQGNYLDQVSLLSSFNEEAGAIYNSVPLDEIAVHIMPRYLTFLEVYFACDDNDFSLRKASEELRRYGQSYIKNFQNSEIFQDSEFLRIKENIDALLAE